MRIIELHNESSQRIAQDPVSEVQLQLTRESAHRGKPGGSENPLPPSSRYPCGVPAVFAERFPKPGIETPSFCLTTFDAGISIIFF